MILCLSASLPIVEPIQKDTAQKQHELSLRLQNTIQCHVGLYLTKHRKQSEEDNDKDEKKRFKTDRDILFVEFFLDVRCNIFLDVEFLKGLRRDINSVLLHLFYHI